MIATRPVKNEQKNKNEVLRINTTLTDETDYLVIPDGYNVSVTFGGAGTAVVSYATAPTGTGADLTGTGDWTVTTENPLQSAQPGAVSALKIVATGAVTVKGRMT